MPYVEPTWRNWLKTAGVEESLADRVFGAISSGHVSREQIRLMAAETTSAEDRLVLLIAVLVWGRGKENGRMRDPIIRALTAANRDQVLEATSRLAQIGKWADAYTAWQLRGLRQPFFTKWLWAASAADGERCCLVLDGNVGDSLGALHWDSREAAGSRRRAARYAAYVEDVHLCAAKLGVSAEDVEFTLYDMGGDLDGWTARFSTRQNGPRG